LLKQPDKHELASNELRTTRSTLNVDLRMVTSNSSEQPAWQRNPIFEFFASLKLAVVLLTMLIIAAIAGTLYESSFDAKVARGYLYGAPWFNLWLVLLGANLACSALAMAQTSCRVSHHGSRYHYAPDGETSRNGILCTPSVNRPRERRMSMRPRSAG
jgi:hypothetical protein